MPVVQALDQTRPGPDDVYVIPPNRKVLEGYVVKHEFPGAGTRRMVLNAGRIVTAVGNAERILPAMVEVDPSWTA